MDNGSKVCVLCLKRDETETTGALSTKDGVTAHQNCLLFSSGLVCKESPQFDDLFGFRVDDVLAEVKRGSKLMCHRCQMKGATAGCEVRRCKKSFHYPCAVQHKAKSVEDAVQGKYVLFCSKHSGPTQNHNDSVNGRPSSVTGSQASITQSEAGPSKVRQVSAFSNDSSAFGGVRPSTSKRRLSFPDKPEGTTSKLKVMEEVLTEDSSCSGEGPLHTREHGTDLIARSFGLSSATGRSEPDEDMAALGPIETDSFDSAKDELIGNDGESPAGSTSGRPPVNGTMAGPQDDEDIILLSDAESESLLPPASASSRSKPSLYPSVVLLKPEPEQRPVDGSSPDRGSCGRCTPPRHSEPLWVHRSVATDTKPPAPAGLPLTSSACATLAPPSSLKPGFNSASFWKSCNAAGCTQVLFAGFLDEMNEICSRIQSDRASREDYDHALTVMTASGKLAQLVAKQQEELQKKTAAMKLVASALRM